MFQLVCSSLHQKHAKHIVRLAIYTLYNIFLTSIPLKDIALVIEGGAKKLLDGNLAHDLRGRVCGILRKAKGPKSNLTKERRTALKDLRAKEDIVILPADKGNATVLMGRRSMMAN